MRKKLIADSRGSMMAESALSLSVFLLLIFATIDIVHYIYRSTSLDFALARTVRWGILGHQDQESHPTEPDQMITLSRADSIRKRIVEGVRKNGITLDGAHIRICPASEPNCTTHKTGGPAEQFIITVSQPISLFFGLYSPVISSSVFARSEPYAEE